MVTQQSRVIRNRVIIAKGQYILLQNAGSNLKIATIMHIMGILQLLRLLHPSLLLLPHLPSHLLLLHLLTPKMVQQMIPFTFFFLVSEVKIIPHPLFGTLIQVHQAIWPLHMQILPMFISILVICKIILYMQSVSCWCPWCYSSFPTLPTCILHSPHLFTNLVSNYHVSFPSFDCLVQDQESGQVMEKGPRYGSLFPICTSSI